MGALNACNASRFFVIFAFCTYQGLMLLLYSIMT